jgi:thioredoxin 1
MATVELTDDNFEETITNNDIVVVDFWAGWCAPCRTFAPVYEKTSEKYPDVVFGKVDTEAQTELAGRFEIRSIPTLMLVREKVILYSKPGAVPAQAFETLLDRMLAVDMAQVREEIAQAESDTSDS